MALVILSVVILASTILLQNGGQSQLDAQGRSAVASTFQEIKALINGPDACISALGAIPIDPINPTAIRLNNPYGGTYIFANPSANQNLISANWQIQKLQIKPISQLLPSFEAKFSFMLATLSFQAVSPKGIIVDRSIPISLKLSGSGPYILNDCSLVGSNAGKPVVLPVCNPTQRLILKQASVISEPIWICQ